MIRPEDLLAQNGLSKTNIRVKVLDTFLRKQSALSEAELKELIGEKCDRTTIYRTLKTFEKSSIVFKLVGDDGIIRYVIDSRKTEKEHNHLHFRCIECNQFTCLHDSPISSYRLPDGYKAIKNNFVISGICPLCVNQ